MDAWNSIPSELKEKIVASCFTASEKNAVMTDEKFLDTMRFSLEHAPAVHKMVVQAIDPYLPIEEERGAISIDWEDFLKQMTVSSILQFLVDNKINGFVSSHERRNKRNLIESVALMLKRDPATMLRQKRVDDIMRSISFSKESVDTKDVEEDMQIVRNSLVSKYKRLGRDVDMVEINDEINMMFGMKQPKRLHTVFLKQK